MSRQRFEDVTSRWFIDDEEIGVLKITQFDASSDMQIESTKYMGDSIPTKDATDNGFRLSMTVHRLKGSADPNVFFDRYRAAINRRNGLGKVRAVVSAKVPGDTARVAYRYDGIHLNISERGSERRPYEYVITGEAESREKL